MKRRRLMVAAVVCVAVAATIGLAAVTLGPIAYSRVFRGVGNPHAPADRIKLNGHTMVRVGTPPWPDRAILVDPSMAGARTPRVIYV